MELGMIPHEFPAICVYSLFYRKRKDGWLSLPMTRPDTLALLP